MPEYSKWVPDTVSGPNIVFGIETPVFGIETPVFGIEIPVVAIETPVFSIETPVVGIETLDVAIHYQHPLPASRNQHVLKNPVNRWLTGFK